MLFCEKLLDNGSQGQCILHSWLLDALKWFFKKWRIIKENTELFKKVIYNYHLHQTKWVGHSNKAIFYPSICLGSFSGDSHECQDLAPNCSPLQANKIYLFQLYFLNKFQRLTIIANEYSSLSSNYAGCNKRAGWKHLLNLGDFKS